MSLAPQLSLEEFSTLALIGCGALLATPISKAHAVKLRALRYIEIVGDHYEATPTGQLRIASGS